MLRTSEVASIYARKTQAQHATVYVTPPVTQYSVSQTNALEPIVELGYASTRDRLADWFRESDEARAYLGAAHSS